jgi:hypothetical protein
MNKPRHAGADVTYRLPPRQGLVAVARLVDDVVRPVWPLYVVVPGMSRDFVMYMGMNRYLEMTPEQVPFTPGGRLAPGLHPGGPAMLFSDGSDAYLVVSALVCEGLARSGLAEGPGYSPHVAYVHCRSHRTGDGRRRLLTVTFPCLDDSGQLAIRAGLDGRLERFTPVRSYP